MLNKYFGKIIFLFSNLVLLISCLQDPLSGVPKELVSGFSKQSYSAPNSVKLNRFTGDSVKLTINDSPHLTMQFKEEKNSTYNFVIRSAVVPDIQISKVELKGFPEELTEGNMKFDFDIRKGLGSLSWTPKSTFVQSSMYRVFSVHLRISFNLVGSAKSIIDKEIFVYVDKSFYNPEFIGFEFGHSDFQPADKVKASVAYIHPFMYHRSEEGYYDIYPVDSSTAELRFHVKDRNYFSGPSLVIEEISNEKVFSVFAKENFDLEKKQESGAIWSLIYQFNPLIFQDQPGVNQSFKTQRVKAHVSSLDYKSDVQNIHFKIFPIINPEYEVLNSEIQGSQDTTQKDGVITINKSTVSVKDRVKVRYTLEKYFVQKYMSFFDTPSKSGEREYAGYEIGGKETVFSDEDFLRNILDFNSRAHSSERRITFVEYASPEVPCKEYVSVQNSEVSYDNITCACDEDFVFLEDNENYYLEKMCSLGVDFSISPSEAENERE